MAKFFVPETTQKTSEEMYLWIIRYVKAMMDCEIEPVRIYSLAYMCEGQQFRATVGEEDPRTGQLILAILKSNTYLICTPYYGVRRGEPIQVSLSEVGEVQYFEAEGLDRTREIFKSAVQTLDDGATAAQTRVHLAAKTLDAVALSDFPPNVAADFLSLKHKLTWRGDEDETIYRMSNADAEDVAAAIRGLYVDVLRLSLERDEHR